MKIISCLLVYAVTVSFWGWITYAITINKLHKSVLSFLGLVLFWGGLIFNIIYTGMLGWNFTPASQLESLLDSITFVIQIVGILLIYAGVIKSIKK